VAAAAALLLGKAGSSEIITHTESSVIGQLTPYIFYCPQNWVSLYKIKSRKVEL